MVARVVVTEKPPYANYHLKFSVIVTSDQPIAINCSPAVRVARTCDSYRPKKQNQGEQEIV